MQTYLLLFVAMAAIFYLLILRPQQRAKKAKAEMAQALEPGVEILTVGGIFGTVVELREADFDLEIADGVIMKMDRRAIASVIRDSSSELIALLMPGRSPAWLCLQTWPSGKERI